jgi:hypothetical protein
MAASLLAPVPPLSLPTPMEMPTQFQAFHLQILRSFYHAAAASIHDDVTVDAAFWMVVHRFILERESLTKRLKDASFMNEIHREALLYREQDNHLQAEMSSPPSKRARIWPPSNSLCYSNNNYISPQRLSQRQLLQQGQVMNSGLKCFGLVTKLLKKRTLVLDDCVHHRSSPYKPVLRQVETHILNLEAKLQKGQSDIHSQNRLAVEDLLSRTVLDDTTVAPIDHHKNIDFQAQMSLLTTKLQLWKMLAADMRLVMQVKMGA